MDALQGDERKLGVATGNGASEIYGTLNPTPPKS